jgi:TPP-dependent pyruvate/acetoin dehydrogenase alpha subunit
MREPSEQSAPPGMQSDEAALRIFRTMTTIRVTENRIIRGLNSGELTMTFYTVRGQEAIPAAFGEHLRREDYMVTTYRGIHDCIAKGVPLAELLAEMCGKFTGTSKGKGGPMHLSDPHSGLMVTSGVVGGGLPIAVGLALSSHMRRDGRVTVVNFGDGATSIGATHEAVNLAALWQLPIVFICQNNRYGEHTKLADYTRSASLAERFATYGLRARAVDGNSILAMSEAAEEAIALARTGGGPTFLECMTYRLGGHSFGSTTEYMPADELAQAEADEPVGRNRRWLIDQRGVADAVLTAMEAEVEAEVEAALEFAVRSEPPPASELLTDVFSTLEAAPL